MRLPSEHIRGDRARASRDVEELMAQVDALADSLGVSNVVHCGGDVNALFVCTTGDGGTCGKIPGLAHQKWRPHSHPRHQQNNNPSVYLTTQTVVDTTQDGYCARAAAGRGDVGRHGCTIITTQQDFVRLKPLSSQDLDEDVLRIILNRLPPSTHAAIELVCQRWLTLSRTDEQHWHSVRLDDDPVWYKGNRDHVKMLASIIRHSTNARTARNVPVNRPCPIRVLRLVNSQIRPSTVFQMVRDHMPSLQQLLIHGKPFHIREYAVKMDELQVLLVCAGG